MNVKCMVMEWLGRNDYWGLCNPDSDCGCGVLDFYPCGDGPHPDCEPAYYHAEPKTMLEGTVDEYIREPGWYPDKPEGKVE